MPEPTITAALTALVGIGTGVLSNRLDDAGTDLYRQIGKRLRQHRPDRNQDLQRALLTAFWQGLLHVAALYGDEIGAELSYATDIALPR